MREIKGLPDKNLLNLKEVADYLGLTERTIERWLANGKLVSDTPLGKSVRITRASVIGLGLDRIKKGTSKTIGVAGRRV